MAKQGVYRVEGRNELLLLENDEWRYIPTEQALFSTGYGWGDVQVIDIATFCKYEIDIPVPAPGWPTTRGYLPNKSWYTTECAKIAPAPEPTPPEPPPEPTPSPPGKIPIPIPPPYKIAWGMGAGNEAEIILLAKAGFNVIQGYQEWASDAHIQGVAERAYKHGMQLLSHCSAEDNVSKYTAKFKRHKDNPGIWGWQVEEPFPRKMTPNELKGFYSTAKGINPNWKIFIAFALSDWYAQGYATSGICDVFGVDIYRCGAPDYMNSLRNYLEKLFKNAMLKLIDNYGAEHCPVIQAWAESVCPTCIRDQYETYKDVMRRPISGLAYYTTSGFLPGRSGALECIWNQIVAMNKALGGYSPAIITIETLTHACGAKIEYQVSSVAAHNVALTCPYDGAPLGVKGLSGSAIITNIDEMASKLQGEIATLNTKIADLQGKIEALKVQVAEAREIIGD